MDREEVAALKALAEQILNPKGGLGGWTVIDPRRVLELIKALDALRDERDVLKKSAVDDELTLDEYADELRKAKSRLAMADALAEGVAAEFMECVYFRKNKIDQWVGCENCRRAMICHDLAAYRSSV